MRHIQGLEQLFAAHGPVTDSSDPLVKILVKATRFIMITVSLYNRQPSLMSRPEWRAVNINTDQSVDDSALSYLLDALAQLPTLYQDLDALVSVSQTQATGDMNGAIISFSASDIQPLLTNSLLLLADIRAQRTRWMDSHPKSEFPSLPTTHNYPIRPCPCPIVKHFLSLDVANAFSLYNSLVILINKFIIALYQLLPVEDRDSLAEKLASEQVCVAAMEILKGLDYHLTPDVPAPGSVIPGAGSLNLYLLFPIRVSFQVLSQSKSSSTLAQKLWLEDIFDLIKGKARPWVSNKNIFRLG